MNRKLTLLVGCLAVWLAAAGCASQTQREETPGSGANANAAATTAPVAGDCLNSYYPIGPTVRREYRTTFTKGGLPPSTYTETFAEVGGGGFVQRQQFGDGKLQVERRWTCAGSGLGSQDYADISVSQSNFKFKTLRHEGVLVPAPADWKQGGAWDYSYDVSGEGQIGTNQAKSGGAGPALATKGTIKVRNVISAQEPVKVAAGSFDAWKVQSTITQNLQTTMNGMSVPTNVTITMDSWYAKDVGLIKSES